MYTLKITNHANKKTELSEHTFFFGAIFKALVSVAKIFGILLLVRFCVTPLASFTVSVAKIFGILLLVTVF